MPVLIGQGAFKSVLHLETDLPTDVRVRVTFDSPQRDKSVGIDDLPTCVALSGYERSMSTPMKDRDDDDKKLQR